MPRGTSALKVQVLIRVTPAGNRSGDASTPRSVIVEPRDNAKSPRGVSRVHLRDESFELEHVLVKERWAEQVGVTRDELTDTDADDENAAALRPTTKPTSSSKRLGKSIVQRPTGINSGSMRAQIRLYHDGGRLSGEISTLRLNECSLGHAVLIWRGATNSCVIPRVERGAERAELGRVPGARVLHAESVLRDIGIQDTVRHRNCGAIRNRYESQLTLTELYSGVRSCPLCQLTYAAAASFATA